jgi:hypothetical protein
MGYGRRRPWRPVGEAESVRRECLLIVLSERPCAASSTGVEYERRNDHTGQSLGARQAE